MAVKDFTRKKSGMPDFVKDALKKDGDPSKNPIPQPHAASIIETENLPKVQPFSLPFASEDSRLLPDAVLRSALFSVQKKGTRAVHWPAKEVASIDNIKIFYTGQQLDQGDLDVWETVLHLSAKVCLGEKIFTSLYEMLKIMGMTINGKNYEILEQRLNRLTACSVTIDTPKYNYTGSILAGFGREKETDRIFIRLDTDMAVLFQPTRFSQVDWRIRKSLKGQLAQWLHAFYSTHAKPLPMKVETLHRLCGSDVALLKNFRPQLIKALDTLAEVCTAQNQLFAYEIVCDLVYITKTASSTQQKHLATQTRKAVAKALKNATRSR